MLRSAGALALLGAGATAAGGASATEGSAGDAAWPTVRRDPANTGYDPNGATIRETPRDRWTRPTAEFPVVAVADGTVYLGAADAGSVTVDFNTDDVIDEEISNAYETAAELVAADETLFASSAGYGVGATTADRADDKS